MDARGQSLGARVDHRHPTEAIDRDLWDADEATIDRLRDLNLEVEGDLEARTTNDAVGAGCRPMTDVGRVATERVRPRDDGRGPESDRR